MTMTDYHPESWNPVWKVESILTGFVSFMTSNEWSVGGMQESEPERKKKAAASLKWNLDNDKNNNFISLFSHLFEKLGINHPAGGAKAQDGKEEEKKSTTLKKSAS
jgi:ubiquitin-conjugating enzyme E2 J2